MNLKSKTSANQHTTSKATNECDTPRKKNLRRKVQTLRTKLWRKDKKKKLKFQAEIDSVVLKLKKYLHKILSVSLKGKLSYSIQQKKVKDMQHQIKCWPSQYFIKVGKHIDYSQSCLHFHQKEHYRNICKILTLCLDSMMGVFDALKLKVENMDPKDRCVSLIFDEMALKSALVYNNGLDIIEGFEDLGELGSSHFVADHALAFMVQGLYTKWKQPLAYFTACMGFS